MHSAPNITTTAIHAAREAAVVALEGFRSHDLKTEEKADKHDLVTAYDLACEQRICEVILAAYPGSTIVAEESETLVGDGELTWYIDPIDGTSNFARGIALWAISIGVARDGKMISGVVFDAVHGQIFWADERGAFLRDEKVGEDQPLQSSGYTDAAQATVALNFPLARDLVHRPQLALEQFAEVTKSFAQVRSLGSTCIALAWVAAGWLDVTISFETNPWDIAAGAFIIRRAGGIFHGYDFDGSIVTASHDYESAHYYAAVEGAEFESLHQIMRTQSSR